jgi:hypothetical protein
VTETIAIHTEDDIFELRLSANVLDERSFAESAGRPQLPFKADALAFRTDAPDSLGDADGDADGAVGEGGEYYPGDDGAGE